MTEPRALTPILAARLLGLSGLIPFVLPAFVIHLAPELGDLDWRSLQADYGAVILSFVGALHWGYALQSGISGPSAWLRYGWSVIPALLAWLALQCPPEIGLRLLAGGLVCAVLVDRGLLSAVSLPNWFMQLRYQLTTIAALSLLAASVA
ncbi:MAG: DUF3429 domain-containing protein [Gammaproteobacteria bacterium]|nr:DUF3429 domain-containing protein [Gammaproteobacteria bacterium]